MRKSGKKLFEYMEMSSADRLVVKLEIASSILSASDMNIVSPGEEPWVLVQVGRNPGRIPVLKANPASPTLEVIDWTSPFDSQDELELFRQFENEERELRKKEVEKNKRLLFGDDEGEEPASVAASKKQKKLD